MTSVSFVMFLSHSMNFCVLVSMQDINESIITHGLNSWFESRLRYPVKSIETVLYPWVGILEWNMIVFLAKEIQFFPMKFSPTKATMAMAGLASLDNFIIRRFIFAFVGRVCREHNEGRWPGLASTRNLYRRTEQPKSHGQRVATGNKRPYCSNA